MPTPSFPLAGGCDCRRVRYQLLSAPLFVHCCHCRWCQRETGSAFALNAMIETDRVEL
ncbi:MAG TPA: GFA family protein, partial [Casimicrobiaceae bacterium]|nr:GFA family protein [Casimicrobiaceae bacterium]